ncbi:Beta-1 [Hyphodiscus hymeniophilus]|uniref:Beta-1 n=1 Tax=Hyphodiscus hymeniophilus TaxID=353542 RepID=A0A9P6VJH5_9HELO|nr:Beta-1 [Hyphodiscus hymeniophilus]
MAGFDSGKRRVFVFLSGLAVVVLFINLSLLSGTDVQSKIKSIPIPGKPKAAAPDPNLPKIPSWHHDNEDFENYAKISDQHPIAGLMKVADDAWESYEEDRSTTFKETVAKYRRKYGRHPPPGFRDWYKFARDRNVHNVDDFEQIMDDLRPFWAIEPEVIRSHAAHLSENEGNGISGLHIRDHKIWKMTFANWRMETFAKMVETFVEFLPDMDIAMNRLDQPRIVVPWDEMQGYLAAEAKSRHILVESPADWTKNMSNMLKDNDTAPVVTDPKFFSAHAQQYMLIAKEACPPESPARDGVSSVAAAESLYKDPQGGFITNFNRSSDLCTVGPAIENKHGALFVPSTIVATKSLLPIFGECKVNVNSDILFPANMYYKEDDRYDYDPESPSDYSWDDKKDLAVWRGVTSGGTNTAENYKDMHRQRLVMMANGTIMAEKEVRIMTESTGTRGVYENFPQFHPSEFANQHTDIGFTGVTACVPDCNFYDGVWDIKPLTPLSEQFKNKYVIDVDGMSFSGRWRAFLQSKSLGIKSTIFREWHDSRLFAWRHFVPMDNRYDDLYSILTYFIGLGDPSDAGKKGLAYIQRHDFEARRLGRQGREWASKVLRSEDIEIYTYRLLIEYARIIDDNRDRIGYSGDGSELDKYDAKKPMSFSNSGHV